MTGPVSQNTKDIIVSGLQKVSELSAAEEALFIKALKNGGVKITLDHDKALSIRVYDKAFLKKLNDPQAQKHEVVRELLDQVKQQKVIFTISSATQKEYIFTSEAAKLQFEERKKGKEGRTFTMLDEESCGDIALTAQELYDACVAPQGVKQGAEQDEKTEENKSEQKPRASQETKPLPSQVPLSPSREKAETTRNLDASVDAAVLEGRQKADDVLREEESQIEEDRKREKEKKGDEKQQAIERKEEKRQEERMKLQTDTNQAGDLGERQEEFREGKEN